MKILRRLIALLLAVVLLSGMLGPESFMRLAAYAQDEPAETAAEGSESSAGAPAAEESAAAAAPAAPAATEETPAAAEAPAAQSGEKETEPGASEPSGQSAEKETEDAEDAEDAPAAEGEQEEEKTADKESAAAKTPGGPYDHKIKKIKVTSGLEMSLSGVLPEKASVLFKETKYEPKDGELAVLFKAEIHVYDPSGKEFKPSGKISVELKGEMIRKAIEQGKGFGLIVDEKDKEAEFIKAKKDTVTFVLKEFDLFVLYVTEPVAAQSGAAEQTEEPEQDEPAEEEDAEETPLSADAQNEGADGEDAEEPSADDHAENNAAEDEAAENEAAGNQDAENEAAENEAAENEDESEDSGEENDAEENETVGNEASENEDIGTGDEKETDGEEPLSYRFEKLDEAVLLSAILSKLGLDEPAIAALDIAEGGEEYLELQESEEGFALLARAHFDSVLLSVLTQEGESIALCLCCPEGSVENTLTPEIPGEATMTLTGFIPVGSTAEATPVDVSIDGNGALAAYDIDIFAPDAEGEESWQPAEGETVTVDMYDPSFEGMLYIYHMEDEDSEPELIACVEAKDGGISFEAASFSVYVIVPAPDPASPEVNDTVASLGELAQYCGGSFTLSVYRDRKELYFQNELNGNSAFKTTNQPAAASAWYFEPAGGANLYYISTKIDGQTQYMFNTSGNLMGLSSTNKTTFELSEAGNKRFYFNVQDSAKYLQYSNGGSGIRLYEAQNSNGQIAIHYLSLPEGDDDPYGFDGAVFGLMNYRGGTSAYALMAQTMEDNGVDHLASRSMLVRTDPMDQSSTLYVARDSDATMWTFHSVESDHYTVTAGGSYLRLEGNALTLSETPDEYCVFRVIPGTGTKAGKIRLLGLESETAVSLSSDASKGFGGANANGNNEWLNLMQRSAIYDDDDFVNYSAVKVSVSDNVNVTNGKQVVIYTRVWNETSESYDFYAVNYNGELIPCYESGDSIVWVGTQTNTLLWDFTEYYYEGTNNPNYYYELQNVYSEMYLAPQIADGQILSERKIGINLNGRRYEDYFSSILAWDDPHYDYAGLKAENGRIVSCPMSQAESFYFAVMNLSEHELTPVATVDHSSLGLVMRMVDFNSAVVQAPGSSNSPTTEEQLAVIGTQYYSKGLTQPGLLSTGLSGGAEGYPNATITGRSLGDLFARATEVNNLFIQSIYNGSGYYEFDSTQNFAELHGGSFTVYQELGTVGGSANTRKHGQFMPYNTLKTDAAHSENPENLTNILGETLSDNYPRKYETLYGFQEADDHYFGLEITGHFMQTPNGYDAWGHDIVFEFVGDDDFWLYVDGELIIDLGGIHSALPGSVNYSTGKVSVNGMNTTLYDLFRSNYAGRWSLAEDDPVVTAYLDGIFEEKTVNGESCRVFKDYSAHTVRIFYMERGAGASNLRMRFNLATVNPGEVLLSKEIVGTDKQDYASVKFPFQIFYDENDGEGEKLLEQKIDTITNHYNVVLQNSSEPVEYAANVVIDHVSYDKVFYLKPGQTAVIKMPDDTISYRVRECGVNTTIYDEVKINGADADETVLAGAGETACYECSSASMAERARVIFSNHVNQSELRTLTITKKLFDAAGNPLSAADDPTMFQFRLSLGDDLYRMGSYYVKDPDGNYCRFNEATGTFESFGVSSLDSLTEEQRAQAVFTSSPSGAVSRIMADYSVEVRGLLVGTAFMVEERDYDIPTGYDLRTWTELEDGIETSYTGYKRVAGSYIVEAGDTQNAGIIRDNSNPIIEVHNRRGWGIRAEKIWSDAAIMRSHDDVWFAVFVGESETPLANTARRIDQYNYTTYFFPALEAGADFADYHVREVERTEDGAGGFVYTPIAEGQRVTIGGVGTDGVSVSKEYTVSYRQGTATATAGSEANKRTDTVTNTRVGGLRIEKTDMNGAPLSGAEFELRQGGELIGSYSSGEDGLVSTVYLADGRYTLSETKAPSGYQALTDSFTITASAGSYSVTASEADSYSFDGESAVLRIRNIPFTLQIVKVDEDGAPLAGAHFALYRQVMSINGPRKDYRPIVGYEDLVSGSDGILPQVDASLRSGTYYLTETQPPDDYELPRQSVDLCFTIGSTGVSIAEGEGFTGSLSRERSGAGGTDKHFAYTISVRNEKNALPAPTNYKAVVKPYAKMLFFGILLALLALFTRRRQTSRAERTPLPAEGEAPCDFHRGPPGGVTGARPPTRGQDHAGGGDAPDERRRCSPQSAARERSRAGPEDTPAERQRGSPPSAACARCRAGPDDMPEKRQRGSPRISDQTELNF